MFIVFEGLDGSGSTTQAKILVEKLKAKNISAVHTSEPTENRIGKLIRSALQKEWQADPRALQLLFCADRAQHLAMEVEPAFTQGTWIVCDRYIWSTLAYGALSGDQDFLRQVNADFRSPDFIFLLRVSPETCLQRIEARGAKELFEERAKLERVWAAFAALAESEANCAIIDGEQGMDAIAAQVWGIIEQKFLD